MIVRLVLRRAPAVARLAALAGVAIAQRAGGALCRVAEVDWSQRVEWCGGPWCASEPDAGIIPHSTLYYLEAARFGGSVQRQPHTYVMRNGPFVVAVEWAPDGGGTTRVFLAADELTGDGAEEMRRWHAAKERRWYDEMAAFGAEPEGEVRDG